MMMRKTIRRSSMLVPVAMLFFMMLQFEAIHSARFLYEPTTYTVGDEFGWDLTVDMQSWARGKDFHVGDLLVFKYDDQMYDVAVVNKTGHDTCTVNDGAKVFDSGEDVITLVFGDNYFIDSASDICAAGMKLAINATNPPPSI